jgi:hypothetical protein
MLIVPTTLSFFEFQARSAEATFSYADSEDQTFLHAPKTQSYDPYAVCVTTHE